MSFRPHRDRSWCIAITAAFVAAMCGQPLFARPGAAFDRRDARGKGLPASAPPKGLIATIAGNARLDGTAGDDQFSSVSGLVMCGRGGDDTYFLWQDSARICELPDGGIDTAIVEYFGGLTLPDDVENLVLAGRGSTWAVGNARDNVLVAGTAGASLDGGGGDDVLVGGPGADVFRVRAGTGSDAIVGFTPGRDAIVLSGYGAIGFAQLRRSARRLGHDTDIRLADGTDLVLRGIAPGALRAADFALPFARPAAGKMVRSLDGPGAAYDANGWTILNNAWNSASLRPGTDYTIGATFRPADMTAQTVFRWAYPYVTDYNPAIRAYPAVIVGAGPYGGGRNIASDTVRALPLKVADLVRFTVDQRAAIAGTVSGFTVAYDLWFTRIPNGDRTTISNEVMVWVHTGSFAPLGAPVGRYETRALKATIYRSGIYTALALDRDALTAKLDLGAIVADLVRRGIVKPDEYLASLEFGSEITSGVGALTIEKLDLRTARRCIDGTVAIDTITGSGGHRGGCGVRAGKELRARSSKHSPTRR